MTRHCQSLSGALRASDDQTQGGKEAIICLGNGQSREALGRDFSAIFQEWTAYFRGASSLYCGRSGGFQVPGYRFRVTRNLAPGTRHPEPGTRCCGLRAGWGKILAASRVPEVAFAQDCRGHHGDGSGAMIAGVAKPCAMHGRAPRGAPSASCAARFHALGTIVLRVVARQGCYA